MGAFLGGAIYRIPVLIDGFISAVAANCAIRLVPESKGYIFATHCSAEPAGKFALDAIGMKDPVLNAICVSEREPARYWVQSCSILRWRHMMRSLILMKRSLKIREA